MSFPAKRSGWCLLLAFLAWGLSGSAAEIPSGPAREAADWAGVLQVQLGLRNGYLAAMRQGEAEGSGFSRFEPAPGFVSGPRVERELLDELDQVLKAQGPAWQFCLADAALTDYRAGLITNLPTAEVARLSTNWSGAYATLKQWMRDRGVANSWSLAEAYQHRLAEPAQQTNWIITATFKQACADTALEWDIMTVAGATPIERRTNTPAMRGLLRFKVLRMTRADLSAERFKFPVNPEMSAHAGVTPEYLTGLLEPLVGQVWSPRRIKRQIGDAYARMGYAVADEEASEAKSYYPGFSVEVEVVKDPEKRVLIKGTPRLVAYRIAAAITDTQALDRVLYELLPSDDWHRVRDWRSDYLYPIVWRQPEQTNVVLEFTLLPLTNATGLRTITNCVNQNLLTDQLRRLSSMGWSAALTNAKVNEASKTVELFVAPVGGARWRTNASSDAASTDARSAPQPPRFAETDLRQPEKLVARLERGRDPVSRFLWQQFAASNKLVLVGTNASTAEKTALLVDELNRVAAAPTLYDPERFEDVSLSKEARQLLKQAPEQRDQARLNHLLLEDAYPRLFRPPAERLTEEKKNHLQFDIEYTPRQPLSYGVSYTRMPLRPGESVSASAGWQQDAFGEVAYSRDFFAFDQLGHRLSFTLNGGTTFEADRLVNDQLVDERRNGGAVNGQLELLRDLGGRSLSLDFGGSGWVIEDTQDDQRVFKDTVASGNLGLHLVSLRDGTRVSPTWELIPSLNVSHSDVAGWYAKPGLQGRYHRLLPRLGISDFPELDLRGHFLWASAGVPTAEMPTFGGEDSVRGYRQDAGLGRMAWSVQSEVWLPLRFAERWSGVDRLLRRQFYLAPFVDIGGLGHSSDDFSGFKAGAGIGLRFQYQQATLRLDWAHALENVPHERGGSVFYFSVTVRPGI